MFITGCNVQKKDVTQNVLEGYRFPTEKEMKEMQNNLMVDPHVLTEDELLVAGDVTLNKKIKNVQNPPNENDLAYLNKMKSNSKMDDGVAKIANLGSTYSLHQTFVNPKIKPINGSYINNVIGKGWDYYGTPYQLGSDRNTPITFDCSDFTRWIHLFTVGMDLPKTSQSQWQYVKTFSKRKFTDLSQAQRGDLLFFMSYKGWQPQNYAGINVKVQPVGHVGIYLGNGLMLHTASQQTGGVRFDKVKGSHLEYRFIGGGQVI